MESEQADAGRDSEPVSRDQILRNGDTRKNSLFKKNLNASKSSEHLLINPSEGEKKIKTFNRWEQKFFMDRI